jgi:methyl-accepting chemotaxis protein
MGRWTFGQKLAVGFGAVVLLAIAVTAIAVYALRNVVASKDHVISVNAQNLVDAAKLQASTARKSAASRAYLISGYPEFLAQARSERQEFQDILARLRSRIYTDEGRRLVREIDRYEAEHDAVMEKSHSLRQNNASPERLSQFMLQEIAPTRNRLDSAVDRFAQWEEQLLTAGKADSTAAAQAAQNLVIVIAVAAVLLAAFIAFFLSRLLTRQLASAVQDIQSSSAELQTTATQQATGAREQATSMNEITTTMSELLATSRQIAESAQSVSKISSDTGKAATAGDKILQRAHESVILIKKQTDLIVNHMLDLGRKSQQIGGILDIINELAEQTNILAINATIEAAGAGDRGRRFAVVAEEIRKLADRVGDSTKDIRSLIEEIRAAVNTTVMATEGGTKAVDTGTREFAEVAVSLSQITSLVSTTTEAAREIELSTKQQTTAVEQVNIAIANVAQVSREAEGTTANALQTASELAKLSRELNLLIRSQPDGAGL